MRGIVGRLIISALQGGRLIPRVRSDLPFPRLGQPLKTDTAGRGHGHARSSLVYARYDTRPLSSSPKNSWPAVSTGLKTARTTIRSVDRWNVPAGYFSIIFSSARGRF